MLFKMMRACIGVYSPDDLWFNQGVELEEEKEREEKRIKAEMDSSVVVEEHGCGLGIEGQGESDAKECEVNDLNQ